MILLPQDVLIIITGQIDKKLNDLLNADYYGTIEF